MDGRLEPRERAAVEAHLAECEDCYEVWMEALQTTAVAPADTEPVPVRRRTTWLIAGGLIAASLAALVLTPYLRRGDPVEAATSRLVAAVGTARFTEARLSPAFAWGAIPSASRGVDTKPPVDVRQAALALMALPAGTSAVRSHHAAGIGHLALGEIDESIAALDRAAELAPSDAEIRSDLAAALLERWRRDQAASDAQRALNEARAAARQAPRLLSASFNVAKAAEAIGLKQAALDAWKAYLQLDSTSAWATEAREEAARLERDINGIGRTDRSSLLEEVLEPWATAQLAGRAFDAASGEPIARRLRESGRDPYLADLYSAVAAAGPASARARSCLAEGIDSMRQSRAAYDTSSFTSAHQFAERAASAFGCAQVSRVDAVMQSAWSLTFSDRRLQALSLLQQVSQESAQRGYQWQLGRGHYIRGITAVGQGHLAKGLEEFAAAVTLFTRAGDAAQAAASRVQRANTLMSGGDPDAAWAELRLALSELHAIRRPRLRYLVLQAASDFSLTADQSDAASAYMELLEAVVREWDVPIVAVDAAARRASLYAGLGRTEDAKTAIAQGRSAMVGLTDAQREQYDAALGWTETRLALVAGSALPDEVMAAAMTRIEKADMTHALAEAYLLRGNAHEARGDLAAATADWYRSADALEAHRARVGSHDLSVSRTSALWDVYGKLILTTLGDPRKSLLLAERSRGQELLTLLQPKTTPGSGDVASLLPNGVLGLAYVTLNDRLIVWRISGDRAEVTVQPVPLPALQETIKEWRSGSAEAGATLAKWLVPAGLVGNTSNILAIVPDGPLHDVSFAALRDPGTGRYLVEELVPVVVPSLAVYRQIAAYPARATGRIVIAGSGEAQPALGLAALPQVIPEVTRISAIYSIAPKLGTGASRSALLRSLPTAAVFHFAGHAVADPRQPNNSRLFVVGDDTGDSISPADIAATTLPRGALVVLSACEGARGKPYRGEGAMNLARPFLAAGAAAVLASSAPVPDREASAFVAEVHEHLAAGASLEYGVALVQREAIRDQRPIKNWVSWTVIGTTGTHKTHKPNSESKHGGNVN